VTDNTVLVVQPGVDLGDLSSIWRPPPAKPRFDHRHNIKNLAASFRGRTREPGAVHGRASRDRYIVAEEHLERDRIGLAIGVDTREKAHSTGRPTYVADGIDAGAIGGRGLAFPPAMRVHFMLNNSPADHHNRNIRR
jgi:hypothetical protein